MPLTCCGGRVQVRIDGKHPTRGGVVLAVTWTRVAALMRVATRRDELFRRATTCRIRSACRVNRPRPDRTLYRDAPKEPARGQTYRPPAGLSTEERVTVRRASRSLHLGAPGGFGRPARDPPLLVVACPQRGHKHLFGTRLDPPRPEGSQGRTFFSGFCLSGSGRIRFSRRGHREEQHAGAAQRDGRMQMM